MSNNATAGKGLFYIFLGQIVALFAFIPLLGTIAVLAGAVLSILGFYTLSKVNNDYKNAFILTIVNAVISLISSLVTTGFFGTLLSILSTAVSFLIVYLVCNTTAGLLKGKDDALVARAATIVKINFICAAVSIVCSLLAVIPIINIIAAVLLVVVAIAEIVAAILYLIFLWKSQKLLQA